MYMHVHVQHTQTGMLSVHTDNEYGKDSPLTCARTHTGTYTRFQIYVILVLIVSKCRLFLCASPLTSTILSLPILSSSLFPLSILLSLFTPTPPSLYLCASSQSVSEKCCCQLTFPITPPVAQTMDTLLTSGDRAERDQHLKLSTRARSLSLCFSHTCLFVIYLSICLSI